MNKVQKDLKKELNLKDKQTTPDKGIEINLNSTGCRTWIGWIVESKCGDKTVILAKMSLLGILPIHLEHPIY